MGAAKRGCTDAKWRLSSTSVLVLILWVTLWTTLGAFISYQVLRSFYHLEVHHSRDLVLVGIILRLTLVFAVALCILSYVFVSYGVPRPTQLHAHGALFVLMLPETVGALAAVLLFQWEMLIVYRFALIFAYTVWGARRILFFWLVMQKVAAMGTPGGSCSSAHRWGPRVIFLTFMASFGGIIPVVGSGTILLLRGYSVEDLLGALNPLEMRTWNLPMPDRIIRATFMALGMLASIGLFVTGPIYTCAIWRAMRATVRQLEERHVTGEVLTQVRRTFRQHLVGIISAHLSNNILVATVAVESFNVVHLDVEYVGTMLAHFSDVAGDLIGILLLSGIGVLLFHENPEAGDVSGQIRGLLHSAVLTAQADFAFEGRVFPTCSRRCIASFPGKFLPQWHMLTWMCERGELSSACVFLPRSDPQSRFGKHVECPDTPGQCWCHSLYGASQPWGCSWFPAWSSNIQKAVKMNLELVVIFFPGEVGQGIVDWKDLGTADLWDGHGLGGSQKAEVAFLRKQGFSFVQEGLEAMQLSSCPTPATGTW